MKTRKFEEGQRIGPYVVTHVDHRGVTSHPYRIAKVVEGTPMWALRQLPITESELEGLDEKYAEVSDSWRGED